MTKLGYGEHIWNLRDGAIFSILRLCKLAHNILGTLTNGAGAYVVSVTYVLALSLIKISLLFLYLEIFRTRRFKISTYVVLACVSINNLTIFVISIFVCKPIEAYWNQDIQGSCVNQQRLAYVNSSSALVQDVVLLVLPLMFIRNLQMQRSRKVAVGLMFAIGTMGCIATVMRIQSLSVLRLSMDPTWDHVAVTFWTEVELATSIICVSLPSIRVLITHMLPSRVKEFIALPAKTNDPTSKQALSRSSERQNHPSQNRLESFRSIDQSVIGKNSTKRFVEGFLLGRVNRHSLSYSPDGSQRLITARGCDDTSCLGVICPPYQRKTDIEAEDLPVEHLTVPELARKPSITDSGTDGNIFDVQITALPDIGNRPECTFSNLIYLSDSGSVPQS